MRRSASLAVAAQELKRCACLVASRVWYQLTHYKMGSTQLAAQFHSLASMLHDWASHGADAFRYLSLSWRETMPSEVEADPLAQLIAEVKRPRTYNDLWRQYIEERIEAGEEIDADEPFDLNNDVEFK